MKKILVTDLLFIFDEHIEQLNAAGYEIERIDTIGLTEDELCQIVKGKEGYIVGGLEKVTKKVLLAAKDLEAIVYTGTAWDVAIDKTAAKELGIKVANAPHNNVDAVAEWVFSTSLAMNRNLFALGNTGNKNFKTSRELKNLKIGIIGLGHIGSRLAEIFDKTGAQVAYWSKNNKNTKFTYKDLNELLSSSDFVLVCLSIDAGAGWLNKDKLALLKDKATVTCITEPIINENDLLDELKQGRIRAFLDFTPNSNEYLKLPREIFYCSNSSTAFNTETANQRISNSATRSMINLLDNKDDKHRVA